MATTYEPSKLRAGTTFAWERNIANFPASVWTLQYTLNASGLSQIQFSATADGDTFVINVPASTTTGYAAGSYAWYATVTNGSTVFEIDSGTIEIISATATGNDLLDAKANLAAAEAELQERVTGKPSSYSIKDRSLTRMDEAGLMKAIEYWRRRVDVLTAQDRARKGRKNNNIFKARFR